MSMITTQDLERLQREQGKWQEPPKTHDTRKLAECLWATFSAPTFNCCIQPGRLVETLTGPLAYLDLCCAHHHDHVRPIEETADQQSPALESPAESRCARVVCRAYYAGQGVGSGRRNCRVPPRRRKIPEPAGC